MTTNRKNQSTYKAYAVTYIAYDGSTKKVWQGANNPVDAKINVSLSHDCQQVVKVERNGQQVY